MMNRHDDDEMLARRLTGALRASAETVRPEPGEHQRFDGRIDALGGTNPLGGAGASTRAAVADAGGDNNDAGPGTPSSRHTSWARWRIQILAAAAVVVVAVLTSALVTGGFRGTDTATPAAGDHAAAAPPCPAPPATAATVPIDTTGGMTIWPP